MNTFSKIRFLLLAISVIGAVFAFSGCGTIHEDDRGSQNCSSGCATIKGKLITAGGSAGIADVDLRLRWLGSNIVREKAALTTGSDGSYNFTFTPRDDEKNNGIYEVLYDVDKKKYLLDPSDQTFSLYADDLNSVYTVDYLIPSKAYLYLIIENPEDIKVTDSFYCSVITPYGANGDHAFSEGGDWNSFGKKRKIAVGGGQEIQIQLTKKKNGNTTTEVNTYALAVGETKTITVSF